MGRHHQWARQGLLIAISGIAFLGGCKRTPPEIERCEELVRGELLAPTTYKRVAADTYRMDDVKPRAQWAVIDYDSANAYGVPIRGRRICKFPFVGNEIDLINYIDDSGVGSIEPDNLDVPEPTGG